MHSVAKNKGFTIFEALIYIALFGFILGGGIASAYQIFEGSAQVQNMAEREVELNFVLRKLDWALNGGELQEPDPGETVATLRVLKDGDVIDFKTDAPAFQMIVDPEAGTPDIYDLSSPRLEISSSSFSLIDADPDILEITLNIDGDTVGPIKRFIR